MFMVLLVEVDSSLCVEFVVQFAVVVTQSESVQHLVISDLVDESCPNISLCYVVFVMIRMTILM